MDGSMTKTMTAAGLAAAGLGPLDAVAISLFGVASTTVFMALAGSVISFAYNEGENTPKISRKKMYYLILGNAAIAASAVSVAPGLFGWEWYSTRVEGSVALLLAVGARWAIPLFLKMLPEIAKDVVSKWFGIGEYKRNRGGTDETI